jgi:Sulfotransferase family
VPVFRSFIDLQVLRGIRAFLSLEGGVVRDALPARGKSDKREQSTDPEIARRHQKLSGGRKDVARVKAADSEENRSEDVPIFFIVGRPKSGTTWLQRMLNLHPEIVCKGEGWFFGRYDRNETFEKVQDNNLGQQLRPGSLHNTLAECDNLRIWIERTVWSRGGDVEEHIAHLTREAVRYFLRRQLTETADKRIVGDKTPLQSAGIVREIGTMFPEAKVVHIIRDGRDVAVSHTHHRWNRVRPVEEGGRLTPEERDKRDRYRENAKRFLASGESIFSEQYILAAAKGWRSIVGNTHRDAPFILGDRYTEVRYEDLLERPEEEMGRLFCFLGASDDEGVVRRSVEKVRFEKVARRQRGDEDSTAVLRKGVSGDWRSVFTERDRRIFGQIANDLLVELGYERGTNQ